MPLSQFLSALSTAFESGKMLKCTLSRPTASAPADLKNIYLRPVALKKGLYIAFNYRFKTRDEVKNFDLGESLHRLETMLGHEFLQADLLTPDRDYNLNFAKNGEASLVSKKAEHDTTVDTAHDRSKQRLLDSSAPWLHTLGITTSNGQVRADTQDKWRQINKYLEIIDNLLRENPLPEDACIADMGSGKGYLTFALYDFLKTGWGFSPASPASNCARNWWSSATGRRGQRVLKACNLFRRTFPNTAPNASICSSHSMPATRPPTWPWRPGSGIRRKSLWQHPVATNRSARKCTPATNWRPCSGTVSSKSARPKS